MPSLMLSQDKEVPLAELNLQSPNNQDKNVSYSSKQQYDLENMAPGVFY